MTLCLLAAGAAGAGAAGVGAAGAGAAGVDADGTGVAGALARAARAPEAVSLPAARPVDGTPLVDAALPGLIARSSEPAGSPPARAVAGQSAAFFTVDLSTSPPSFIEIRATLRASSATTAVYVEDAEWGERVAQSDVDSILDAFDRRTPAGSYAPAAGIASIVEEVFGPPSDVDGDGRIHLLVLDIRDGWSGSGAHVAGYYTGHDQTLLHGSNHRDLVYVDCQPTRPGGEAVLGTVAHEYQHLVHHHADPDEGRASPFMNEAMSELASYLCGYGLRPVDAFADQPDVALEHWENSEADYARASLWALYLYEQLGPGVIRSVVGQPANGMRGVTEGLVAAGSSRDGSELVADWFVANAINDAAADPRFGYRAWDGRVAAVDVHDVYPAAGGGAVAASAADVVHLRNGTDMALLVEATGGGNGLRARAVVEHRGRGTLRVEECIAGQPWREDGANGDTDATSLIVFTTGDDGAGYRYLVTAVTGDVVELGYDDGDAESFGALQPSPNGRALAVRFTLEDRLSALRAARCFMGGRASFEVHLWAADGDGGLPGISLMSPLEVSTAGADGWVEVDLGDDGPVLEAGDVYLGLVLPPSSGSGLVVGLDDDPPHTVRSWLLDDGSWTSLAELWPATPTDLMVRMELETLIGRVPGVSIAVVQEPSSGARVDVVVDADAALRPGSVRGAVVRGDQADRFWFDGIGTPGTEYVARSAACLDAGSTQVIVEGVAARGAAAFAETLVVRAEWLATDGGSLAVGARELVLPPGALRGRELVTAQLGAGSAGGDSEPSDRGAEPPTATMAAATAIHSAVVTFGPQGLALGKAATVLIPASGGQIAEWEGGAWRPLATRRRGGRLEATTVRLGSFTVVPGESPPAALRLERLGANPVRSEGLFGLEVDAAVTGVQLRVYDVAGRSVLSRDLGALAAGWHAIQVPLAGRASGVYWLEVAAGARRGWAKLVHVR